MLLSEYYFPLSPVSIFIFVLIVIYLDCLGTSVRNRVFPEKLPNEGRVVNWLIGLGVYVFWWFVLGFFIPPQRFQILVISLGILPFILPRYFSSNQPKQILNLLKQLLIPVILIAPFLPAVFVKASLPPYYGDEMVYHFISPAQLQSLSRWSFGSGIYENLPRLMETYYTLSFSLFRTYSFARLTNFTVLLTALSFGFLVLKRNFNLHTAFFFPFLFLSVPHQIVLTSTLGMVDVPTYSFITIAVLFIFRQLISHNFDNLLLSSLFWSLAIGTKYSAITASAAAALTLTLIFLRHWSGYQPLKYLKKTPLLLIIALVFGGYWYLKNLIYTGNPTYPFFFPCYRFEDQCQVKSEFFGSWTTQVSWANFPEIFSQLFVGLNRWSLILAVALILMLANNNPRTRLVSNFLVASFLIELLLLKRFSGFMIRYHQHLQLLLFLFISIQLTNTYKWTGWRIISGGFLISLVIILVSSMRYHLLLTYRQDVLPREEINYALGKASVYDWIQSKFDRMWPIIQWCEKNSASSSLPLVKIDPDVIWYQDDGKAAIFMTNCQIHPRSDYFSDNIPLPDVIPTLVKSRANFRLISLNPCLPESEVLFKDPREEELELHLRRINNIIVCKSRPLPPPYLYEFNYFSPDSGFGSNPKSR